MCPNDANDLPHPFTLHISCSETKNEILKKIGLHFNDVSEWSSAVAGLRNIGLVTIQQQ